MSGSRFLGFLCMSLSLLATALWSGASAADSKIAIGWGHSILVNADQTVSVYGYNSAGQIGDGTTADCWKLKTIEGISGVRSVAAWGNVSLALKTNGEVWAWGDVPFATGAVLIPTKIDGLEDIKAIAVGGAGVLAVEEDGTVWGFGSYFGTGTPAEIAGLEDIKAVAVGDGHFLALTEAGTVMAWGDNSEGQTGQGSNIGDPFVPVPFQIAVLSDIKLIGAGSHHSAAVEEDGTVWTWGRGYTGALGVGGYSPDPVLDPAEVPDWGSAIALSCSYEYTFIIRSDGTVWYAGSSEDHNITGSSDVPIQRAGVTNGVAIAACGRILVLQSDGIVQYWGGGTVVGGGLAPLQDTVTSSVASLGTGIGRIFLKNDRTAWDYTDGYPAPQVMGIPPLVAVSSSYYAGYLLGLKLDGTATGVGANITNVVAANSTQGGQYYLLKSDGTVLGWGANSVSNSGNYVGTGTTEYTIDFPTPITGLTNIVKVPVGKTHKLAITSDGLVKAWGYNESGQLGIGSTADQPLPVPVPNITGAVNGSLGDDFSLVLDSNGEVWSWGGNGGGQLGNGTFIGKSEPEKIVGFDNVGSVAAGWFRSMAVKKDGTVWEWGMNYNDGFIAPPLVLAAPTQVPSAFVGPKGSVHVGYYGATYALKEDGTLLDWTNSIGKIAAIVCPDPVINPLPGYNALTSLPDFTLTSSAPSNTVPMKQPVTVTCNITGAVAKVAFYVNGVPIGEDTSSPFTATYSPKSWGDFEVAAIVTMTAGDVLYPKVIRLAVPYDSDGDSLPDWKEYKYVGSLAHGLSNDSDGDGITNQAEILANTDPFYKNTLPADADGDGMGDDWEIQKFGSILYRNGMDSLDGDWITDLEEYQLGLDPFFNDDSDLDGWIDSDEAVLVNYDLNDGIVTSSDIAPWTDTDGDGLSDALEIKNRTNPYSKSDPATSPYEPVVKLAPSGFNGTSYYATWANAGSLGGQFVSESDNPISVMIDTVPAVEFKGEFASWMVGPRPKPWMNGSGSRTVVAWIYNKAPVPPAPQQDDVLFSWGAHADSTARLFSCRYGQSTGAGAFSASGGGTLDFGWGGAPPVTGSWSFVIYRYDGASGTLLAARDFVAGVWERNVFLQTEAFNTSSHPHPFVIGSENLSGGGRKPGLMNGFCIGDLRVFDRPVSISEIIDSIYTPTKATYGQAGVTLFDTDGDKIPDLLEDSMGFNKDVADSDGDGIQDGAELIAGTDPLDFFNGVPHYVAVTGGNNQVVVQGKKTPLPIEFTVFNYKNEVIPSAPVKISIPTPGSISQLYHAVPPGTTPLTLPYSTQSGSNGKFSVIFEAK